MDIEPHHRLHRAVRLRQVHAAALLQPHERPGADGPHRRRVTLTAWTSTTRGSTRSRCAAASAWSSRSPTRSPSRSTRTSPSGPRIAGYKGEHGRAGRAQPAPGRHLGRGQGQAQAARARRSPAASSSASASPAPSPSSRTSSSWTSPARPSTRWPRSRSRSSCSSCATSSPSSSSPTTCSRLPGPRDETVFLTMGDDRAGYLVEKGPTQRDLHQPQEPADRGLRLRSLRMRTPR